VHRILPPNVIESAGIRWPGLCSLGVLALYPFSDIERALDEFSPALFMKKYYEGLLSNKKKSVALAEARDAVFASGSKNPFYWAPFIVIGE
jgi:hypothetical protein